MKDIVCPHCGTAFHVDESTYETIVSQVRNTLFEEELDKRTDALRKQFELKEDAGRLRTEKDYEARLAQREKEIGDLQNTVTRLRGEIDGYEARKEAELLGLKAQSIRDMAEAMSAKEKEIAGLKSRLDRTEQDHKIKLMETQTEGKTNLNRKEQEIIALKAQLDNEKLSAQNRENQLREHHQLQLRDKQDEIERLRDFKLRQSTKMVGESLEQHCSILFAQAQSMGLYPSATFGKDTIAVEGTKGDFIFRDFIDDQEYISVMFEMKNEVDTTATKHRNDDFLDKLDKDRTRKKCEYAVLVSMLEQDNELYEAGIVDKSHRYPKMLVIRPQFFMPVLRLLTEGARKGFNERKNLMTELEKARNESLDFARFQDKLNVVKDKLNTNYATAHKKFMAATEGIDKAIEALKKQIENLKKIKDNFEASDKRLLKTTEIGGEELTVKKLTHGIPAVKKMIEEAQ